MRHTEPKCGLDRVTRHEKLFAWPLFAASLIWIGSLTVVWTEPHPDPLVRRTFMVILATTWLWFIVDYLVRLVLAGGDRKHFARVHLLELGSVAVPVLRPFMILVSVWRLPVFLTGSAARLRLRYGVMTVTASFLFVYVNAYLVWAAEKGSQNAQIKNFGDAIWWGFTTITTVGYGDLVPVTVLGRVLAVGLMLGGVIVVGVTTATLLSTITAQLEKVAIVKAEKLLDPPKGPPEH